MIYYLFFMLPSNKHKEHLKTLYFLAQFALNVDTINPMSAHSQYLLRC